MPDIGIAGHEVNYLAEIYTGPMIRGHDQDDRHGFNRPSRRDVHVYGQAYAIAHRDVLGKGLVSGILRRGIARIRKGGTSLLRRPNPLGYEKA